MTTQSEETMESRLKKTGFYNFIGLTSRNGQREIKSFIRSELSLQHTKDLQEFKKVIGEDDDEHIISSCIHGITSANLHRNQLRREQRTALATLKEKV